MDIIKIIDNYKNLSGYKIAQIYKDKMISYSELISKSDALACYLIEKLDRDKTPILIYGHKEFEMIISFLACMKSGHPYIPVDDSQPYERVKSIVQNSKTKLIINNSKLSYSFDEVIEIKKEELSQIMHNYEGIIPDESYHLKDNDTIYIIYTSGSTGIPKGVEIYLSNLKYFLKWCIKLYNKYLSEDKIFLNQISYSFDVSVMNIFSALILGKTLFTVDNEMLSNYRKLFHYFKGSNLSTWISTPSTIEIFLNDENFNEKLFPKLELVILAGEPLTKQCVENIYNRFPNVKVINGYGPTEATILSTYIEITKEMLNKEESLPIGYPLEDSKILIKDDNGDILEEGIKGEICIQGKNVGKGYYLNETATKEVFVDEYIDSEKSRSYKTGDIGFIKSGIIYYCGRKDFQIKLNGNRIELEDIESNLKKITLIKNAIVVLHKVKNENQYLCAFVMLEDINRINDKKVILEIKKELKEYVPNYMIPKKIVLKESFPININGKIDRKLLLQELENKCEDVKYGK